jgi:hypothetical protein
MYISPLTTSRRLTRRLPPPGLPGGRSGLTSAHSSPRSTVHDYLSLWNWDGTLDRIHHELYLKCREKAGRQASPTAGIIDSQSVKSAEKGGLASIRPASMWPS